MYKPVRVNIFQVLNISKGKNQLYNQLYAKYILFWIIFLIKNIRFIDILFF